MERVQGRLIDLLVLMEMRTAVQPHSHCNSHWVSIYGAWHLREDPQVVLKASNQRVSLCTLGQSSREGVVWPHIFEGFSLWSAGSVAYRSVTSWWKCGGGQLTSGSKVTEIQGWGRDRSIGVVPGGQLLLLFLTL